MREHTNVFTLPDGRILKFISNDMDEVNITIHLSNAVRKGHVGSFPLVHEHGKCKDGNYYIVMENVGRSLEEYLENNIPLPLSMLDIILQVEDILEFLNKEGITHGDLHAGNITIDDGRVFLIDFGMSSFGEETDNTIDSLIGSISQITPRDIIRVYPSIPWHREGLSLNPNLTLDILQYVDTLPSTQGEWIGSYMSDIQGHENLQDIFSHLGLDEYGDEVE